MKKIDLERVRPERSEKRRVPGKGAVPLYVRVAPELKAALEKEAGSTEPKLTTSLLINLILEERYPKA